MQSLAWSCAVPVCPERLGPGHAVRDGCEQLPPGHIHGGEAVIALEAQGLQLLGPPPCPLPLPSLYTAQQHADPSASMPVDAPKKASSMCSE